MLIADAVKFKIIPNYPRKNLLAPRRKTNFNGFTHYINPYNKNHTASSSIGDVTKLIFIVKELAIVLY